MSLGLVFDIIFLLMAVIIFPLYIQYRRKYFKDRPLIKGPAKYVKTIIIAFTLLALLMLSWIVNERTFADLGLGYPDRNGLIGIGVAVTLILSLIGMMSFSSQPASLENKDREAKSVTDLMPKTRLEAVVFIIFALIIGFAWEVLYRGALIYYFSPHIGVVFSALLAAMIYTIFHGAPSLAGYLQTFILALLFLLLFVLSRSLWGPIIIHTALPLIMLIAHRRLT